MSITLSYSKSTFGHVYEQAMQTQLQIIGNNLSELRKSRDETIDSVADAVITCNLAYLLTLKGESTILNCTYCSTCAITMKPVWKKW